MATFFADSAGSQGTGSGLNAANACTFIEFITNDPVLHTPVVPLSVCFVKNGTTITFDGSAGVFAATSVAGLRNGPIQVVGYSTAADYSDGGVVVVQDSDNGATNNCFDVNHDYWEWHNIKVMNPRDGWNMETAGVDANLWVNCEVQDAANDGWVTASSTGDRHALVNCHAHGCAGFGFDIVCRNPNLANCVSIDNNIGFRAGAAASGTALSNCLAHGNTSFGYELLGETLAVNSVANRNGGSGWRVSDADAPNVLVNCGSTSNGGFGIEGISGTIITAINCGLNPNNETNTSGKSSVAALFEVDPISGDPDYTDSNPATKTDVDLSISASSAWKAAGIGLGGAGFTGTPTSIDVGVSQRVEPTPGTEITATAAFAGPITATAVFS